MPEVGDGLVFRPCTRAHDFEVLTVPGDPFRFELPPGANPFEHSILIRFTWCYLPLGTRMSHYVQILVSMRGDKSFVLGMRLSLNVTE